MMKEIAPEVEPKRDHLHSNYVQILVATGWLGLGCYLAWMIAALVDAVVFARKASGTNAMSELSAVAVLLMLTGLLINGIVEYNFGDAELVLACALIIGCAAAGRRRAFDATCVGTETAAIEAGA
jgi:O-antigen ligase